jgi:hypothetical protein
MTGLILGALRDFPGLRSLLHDMMRGGGAEGSKDARRAEGQLLLLG